MRELGYVEGKDYQIAVRFTTNDFERLPTLVAELVSLKVELILIAGTASANAARKLAPEIPLVVPAAGDPVGTGLANTLARPGGNVTGLTNLAIELHPKRLQLLHEILPGMKRVGFLYNAGRPTDQLGVKQFATACKQLNLMPVLAAAEKRDEFAAAFDKLKQEKADGLIVSNTFSGMENTITEQAAKIRIPAVYGGTRWASSGGLVTYSPNIPDLYRRSSRHVDKILRGAKAGDIPFEQPTTFELVINMKTAKALGIKIPQSILVRADKVIG
jgi:putative ABC transport system substrate-binding protein